LETKITKDTYISSKRTRNNSIQTIGFVLDQTVGKFLLRYKRVYSVVNAKPSFAKFAFKGYMKVANVTRQLKTELTKPSLPSKLSKKLSI
jgi:hypothetical protein